jgi:hypothetical protein
VLLSVTRPLTELYLSRVISDELQPICIGRVFPAGIAARGTMIDLASAGPAGRASARLGSGTARATGYPVGLGAATR